MKPLSSPRKPVSVFVGYFVDARPGRTASVSLPTGERRHYKNGWKQTACKIFEPSTEAFGTQRPGRKTIPLMNKPDADSRGHTTAFFCVSLNPAIDTRLVLDEFCPGRVNRASEVHRTPGGKAAHVAMVLQALG